jgi:L-ascorbate metabolism protein UlaG (beta-lactamase superfamily)
MFVLLVSFLVCIAVTLVIVLVYMQHPKFGKLPSGERLERIKASVNYKNGVFQNESITPDLSEEATYFSVLKEFVFGNKKDVVPTHAIPSTKVDLLGLATEEDVMVWFGHSSYFIQIDGKRILVDPVLSGAASPVSFSTKAFKGTNPYAVNDLPEIDYLFISHDHYDHLDYETIIQLKPKVKQVICGLGTGAHLEHWGYNQATIIEKDWHEVIQLAPNFIVNTVPARHFSGRGIQRNKALWLSYVLQTPTMKLFIGGDSGYDAHFEKIGAQFGPFDLAIVENGQYDKSWKYIHLMPEQVLQTAIDLKAARLFPVHSSKFALANHAWHAPLTSITALNTSKNIPLLTPIIGEKVHLKNTNQTFTNWWEGIN